MTTTEDNELDTAIRNFKEYVKGNGSFDELDFKEYIIDGLVAKAELALLERLEGEVHNIATSKTSVAYATSIPTNKVLYTIQALTAERNKRGSSK